MPWPGRNEIFDLMGRLCVPRPKGWDARGRKQELKRNLNDGQVGQRAFEMG